MLKTGVVFAAKITTVSPTYAREIQTPEFGCGLDVALAARSHDLVGSLVEAVKGYAQHERQVLEKVAAARSSAEGARTQGRRGAAGTAESR